MDFSNIPTAAKANFVKHNEKTLNAFNVKYDYDSVMHYSTSAFAVDPNKPTITPLKPLGKAEIGQRERLSKTDIKRINNMYCKD